MDGFDHCCGGTNRPSFQRVNSNFLFASLLWGSVGFGYWIYGKKQREMMPMVGGVAMISVSYLVNSWLLMTLLCLAMMVAVFQLMKRGH
jgi:hypothetical protein